VWALVVLMGKRRRRRRVAAPSGASIRRAAISTRVFHIFTGSPIKLALESVNTQTRHYVFQQALRKLGKRMPAGVWLLKIFHWKIRPRLLWSLLLKVMGHAQFWKIGKAEFMENGKGEFVVVGSLFPSQLLIVLHHLFR